MGTIIYPPTLDWSYMVQRPQQVMRQFARNGHSIMFYNKSAQEGRVVEFPEPGIAVIRHSLAFVDELLPLLPTEGRLYWTSWSRKLPHARTLGVDRVVYDCVDDFPDWEEEERQFAASADLIICTASHLETKMRQLLPNKPIYLVPNGCDYEHFAEGSSESGTRTGAAKAEADSAWQRIAGHSGPVIGYIGAWAPWVNEDWIRAASAAMPDALFYIAGPTLREDTGPLGPNVVMLGYRRYEELPALLRMTRVCVIPFHLNRITMSTNPVKVYEYLAAGKPVVSSPLPEVLPLQPSVFIAHDRDEFALRVEEACLESADRNVERSVWSRQFSWEERFKTISEALGDHFPDWKNEAAGSLPVAEWEKYWTKQLPLRFRTVNSYYPDKCLLQDPPYVGCPAGGVYETFLSVDTRLFPGSPLRVYLEFDAHVPPGGVPDALPLMELSVAKPSVPLERLTDRTKPECRPLADMSLKRSIDDSLALDLTPYLSSLPENGRFLIKLASRITRPYRLDRPRLTFLLKDSGQEEESL
ncbi:glycosyltransferase [Gorillibacterium timonense]|uniref:glycosyltransferase n=1 Tax=Gorillibacterium timonense TaxID=1689269 RepID=UPI00071C5364|nr:glycosyltransferase [Gorillibacterium timonense]